MRTAVERRFPSPLAVPAPAGAEGWEELYPPYLLFSEENAAWENGLFWYWDGLHRPDVEYPFDTIMHEAYMMSVSAALSKLFPSPAGRGAVSRVHNGRLYLADVPFKDDAEAAARAPLFARRAGHYYEHWTELSDNWVRKVEEVTAELEAIEVPELPALEDEAVVARGPRRQQRLPAAGGLLAPDRQPLPRLPVPLRDAAAGATSPRSTCASSACRPSRASPSRRSPTSRPASSSCSSAPTRSSSAWPPGPSSSGSGARCATSDDPEATLAAAARRRRRRARVGRRVRVRTRHLVQRLHGNGPLPPRAGVVRRPLGPVDRAGRLRHAHRPRRDAHAPARRAPRAPRPDDGRVPRAAPVRRRPRHLRREPRARAPRRPAPAGSQLLHRAPPPLGVLEQDARRWPTGWSRPACWPSATISSTSIAGRSGRRSTTASTDGPRRARRATRTGRRPSSGARGS